MYDLPYLSYTTYYPHYSQVFLKIMKLLYTSLIKYVPILWLSFSLYTQYIEFNPFGLSFIVYITLELISVILVGIFPTRSKM